MVSPLFKKWIVIGTTSSGKSTLAKALAHKINADFIELDALHWEANWKEAPDEVFLQRVQDKIKADSWVIAGNYSVTRAISWPQAEAVIWLDYPFWTVFWRLTLRTFRRWWNKELLWGKNYENLWTHFKLWSDESLIHWLFKTYWRRKKEYPQLLALPEHQHLHLYHFYSPQETENWLNTIH